VDDVIDPAVGLYLERKTGDRVTRGDVLCQIHWNDKQKLETGMPLIEEAFAVSARPPKMGPLISAMLE
jgi:pyrimidine-nucleoside phosphorylase